MRTKTLLFAAAIFVAGIVSLVAQSNPGSPDGVDVEMQLTWPDGQIYSRSLYYLWNYIALPLPTPDGYTIHSDVTWNESGGGSGTARCQGPRENCDDDLTWPGGRWPELPVGVDTYIPTGSTGSIAVPESFYDEFFIGSLNFHSFLNNITIQHMDQAQFILLTGGEPGSTDSELYAISGGAYTFFYTDKIGHIGFDYTTVPPEQIQIGNLGHLCTVGTNNYGPYGTLYAVLPTHNEVDVTARVNASGYHQFVLRQTAYKLVSQCWASTPMNRARTTIGVGEGVYVFFQPSLPINANWTLSAGSLSSTSGPSTSFFAPSNATTTTITASIAGQPSMSIPFTVKAPSGVSATITSTRNQPISIGVAGAYMHLNVAVQPTSVSFYRVKMEEIGEDASNVTGYFTNHWPMSHKNSGADVWHPVGVDNLIDVASGMDSCSYYGSSHLPSPWSPGGGFTWRIPAIWNIGNGPTNSLPWSDQVFTLGANGTFTITKFGQSVTRTVNDVINPNLP